MLGATLERHGGRLSAVVGRRILGVFGVPTLHEDDALRAAEAALAAKEPLRPRPPRSRGGGGPVDAGRPGHRRGSGRRPEPSGFAGDAVGQADERPSRRRPARSWSATRPAGWPRRRWRSSRPAATGSGCWPPRSAPGPCPSASTRRGRPGRGAGPAPRRAGPRGPGRRAGAGHRARPRPASARPGWSRLAAQVAAEATVLTGRLPALRRRHHLRPASWSPRPGAPGDRPGARGAAGGRGGRGPGGRAAGRNPRPGGPGDRRPVVARRIGSGTLAAPEIFWAIRRLLEVLAGRHPLVVVIDDLHWAQPALLDLVEQVVALAREARILLVAVARPELLEQRPGWSGGRRTPAPCCWSRWPPRSRPPCWSTWPGRRPCPPTRPTASPGPPRATRCSSRSCWPC